MTAYEDDANALARLLQWLSDAEVIELLRSLAWQGNAKTHYLIGRMYEQGRGGLPVDENRAAQLYKLAADQGNADAQCRLGIFYSKGRGGLAVDEQEAVHFYRLAADQGSADAQFWLGVFCSKGRGGLAVDAEEAVRFYGLAANQGHARAQFMLGASYELGYGSLIEDEEEAADFYKLAASQGYPDAQRQLGIYYEQGRGGLAVDDGEAAQLYALAADQGETYAECALGLFYERGRGGLPVDETQAARLYTLAARRGYARAQCLLGFLYQRGRGGLPVDEKEAAQLYKLAADQGNPNAQRLLGIFYEQGRGGLAMDEEEAARLFTLAAVRGEPYAECALGVFYEEGRGGLPVDEEGAAHLYKLSAEKGCSRAQYRLGLFYEQGRGGLTKDDREALHLFKLAADGGNERAKNRIKALSASRGFESSEAADHAESALGAGKLATPGLQSTVIGIERDVGHPTEILASISDARKNSENAEDLPLGCAGMIAAAAVLGLPYWTTIPFVKAHPLICVLSVCLVVGFLIWQAWRAPCPHGVPRGHKDSSCDKCVQEKAELEAKQQRERELVERQRRIDASADKLRESERLRLAEECRLTIEELRSVDPWPFECVIADMFRRLGFEVEQTARTNDGGFDAILRKNGKAFLVECKKYGEGGLSGRRDLQILHSAMITNKATSGFFVTTAGFTRDAIEFAPTVGIELIDQHKLVQRMFASKPAGVDDDSYRSMCRQCEEIVFHQWRSPRTERCPNGHEVNPTLDRASIFPAPPPPRRRARREHRFGTFQVRAERREDAVITGNTYPVKDKLKALGGRWNPDSKAWLVPAEKAEFARALVAGAQLPIAELPKEPRSTAQYNATNAYAPLASGIRAGDRIEVCYLDDNRTAVYTLSDSQNDPSNGVLSVASPLGEQLLNLAEGDELEFEVGDRLRRIRIARVDGQASKLH